MQWSTWLGPWGQGTSSIPCVTIQCQMILLWFFFLKPVLHFPHYVAFGASSRKHTINSLTLW